MQTQPPGDDLIPIPVDLDMLAEVLNADFSHEEDGLTSRPVTSGKNRDSSPMTRGSWLVVTPQGSRSAYEDIVDLAGSVANERLRDLLLVALDGSGAFSRFKDVLGRDRSELDRWFQFSDERGCQRATQWLAEAGYRPAEKAK